MSGSLKYIILSIIAIVIIAAPIFISEHSFGVRCAKAGYKEAELELCIMRVSNGGTVYLENMK